VKTALACSTLFSVIGQNGVIGQNSGHRAKWRSSDKMASGKEGRWFAQAVRLPGTAVWASYLHYQMIQRNRDGKGGKYKI
jgi:hypothetical protein